MSPGAATSDPRPSASRLSTLALVLVGLVIVLCTKDAPGSWADASRLGAIESLAERGTLALDESTYFWQGDKVYFAPHYYSHQPPMLGILGALPYALMHHLFGLSIDSAQVYRVLSLLLTGLPVLAGLVALRRLARRAGASDGVVAGCLVAAGLSTILLPYSVVLNQHGTAAGLVLMAFAALDSRRVALAGSLLSLAATIDMTAMFPALAGLWPVLRGGGPRGLGAYVLGALPPLALHLGINLAVAGDLVPFSLHREAFEYPMSPFLLSSLTGVDQSLFSVERAVYAFGATFGASGLFSHHPILLIAIACGIALPLVRRGEAVPGGLAPGVLPACALGSLGVAGFYLASSNNYSGSAFGMRWFAVFAPLLLLFPAALSGKLRAGGRRATPDLLSGTVIGLSLLWSTAAAALGAINPWAKFHYAWEDSPTGRVATADTPRPSAREHWAAELERIRDRPQVDRATYDQTYQRMIDQHRRLYLRPTPWLDAAGRKAWLDEGLAKLERVVALLDEGALDVRSRPVGHFWLGKFHAELDRPDEAAREYRAALELSPGWSPPEQALRALGADAGE